ncbi:hypothetical protein F5Y15DRAFT_376262 [Xylariaceae sp. FL0016]|nr:hypothetical protein F5Y15DRAFT_376262 [Xylariaceae sp. FL0016]
MYTPWSFLCFVSQLPTVVLPVVQPDHGQSTINVQNGSNPSYSSCSGTRSSRTFRPCQTSSLGRLYRMNRITRSLLGRCDRQFGHIF